MRGTMPDAFLFDEYPQRLSDLAEKWCVDKLHSHSYIPVYQDLFAGRTVHRLLEIGIGYRELMEPFVEKYIHGASLRMWEEYFHEAEIFACDIRPDTLINEGRIHSAWCDQSSPTSLYAMTKAFDSGHWDVIIDDGSHKTEDQLRTAGTLLVRPYFNDGGVYIIEDCQEPERIVEELGCNRVGCHRATIHRFHKRPDDCLVVIQK